MKTFATTVTIATIALMLTAAMAGGAHASEIYKWVDEDGNVHYGDRPTGEPGVERMAIASRPTNRENVDSGVAARLEREAQREESREAAAAEKQRDEELQAEAAERAEKCTTYRDRLQKFLTSRRLYREDDNGERVYLDEGQMQSAREKVQEQVEEYCSS